MEVLSSLLAFQQLVTFWLGCVGAVALVVLLFRLFVSVRRRDNSTGGHTEQPARRIIGFFHPYCNSGGGGERVLWKAVEALQSGAHTKDEPLEIVIYTGDVGVEGSAILAKAKERFNLSGFDESSIRFVYLTWRSFVEAKMYPHFTMLGQSLGSIALAVQALIAYPPHLYIDTTGFAFTYPIARFLFGCKVVCYTHYPTISTDMLSRVHERRPTYNNSAAVAQSVAASWAKVMYYRLFAMLYGLVGKAANRVMVNSGWTNNHIVSLWKVPHKTTIVHPPCDTSTLQQIPLKIPVMTPKGSSSCSTDSFDFPPVVRHEVTASVVNVSPRDGHSGGGNAPHQMSIKAVSSSMQGREPLIISVGQFRPEKDHFLQLEAFAHFVKSSRTRSDQKESGLESAEQKNGTAGSLPRTLSVSTDDDNGRGGLDWSQIRLVMIGGCRNEGDQQRVDALKQRAKELGVEDRVEVATNVPFGVLLKYLSRALVGLHTMWNEHFGIGVVEFMAAGVVPIAHNSGGPKSDIVVDWEDGPTGYLASTPEEYAKCLHSIFAATVATPQSAGTVTVKGVDEEEEELEVPEDRAQELLRMRERARRRVMQFSDEKFCERFLAVVAPVIALIQPETKRASGAAERTGSTGSPETNHQDLKTE